MTHPAQPLPADPPLRRRWGRVRFGYRANALMLFIGRRALWLGYFFVWFAALYFFLLSPKARRASAAYLDRLRGRRNFLRRSWQTYRHMVVYGYLLLDRAVMLAGDGHGFRLERSGADDLYAASARPGGLILLSAHFGIAEAALPYLARKMGNLLQQRPIHIVMFQDLDDATERFHAEKRRLLAGKEIISTKDPLRAGVKIIAALRAGDAVAMRADRRLEGRTLSTPFLGEPLHLPAGPFLAAALTGAPVVTVYTCRLGYRRYAVHMKLLGAYGDDSPGTRDQRIARAAADFSANLESLVRQFPLQWANFYDLWADVPAAPAATVKTSESAASDSSIPRQTS